MRSARARLVGAGAASLLIRVVSAGLELIAIVLLARLLGADEYGLYAYAYALMRTIAIPAQAGFPTLAVREVATSVVEQQWGLLRGFLIRTNQIVLLFAVVASCLIIIVAVAIGRLDESRAILWAMVLLPLIALGNIRGAALRGLHRVIQGQLAENIVRPALFALALGGLWFSGIRVNAAEAMIAHVVAAALACVYGFRLLFQYLPKEVRRTASSYQTKKWLSSALPLSVIGGMLVINAQAPLLILGLMSTKADVGNYSVAARCALVVGMPMTAVNLVVAPYIARWNAEGDLGRIQKLVTLSGGAILAGAIAITITMWALGKTLIIGAFGSEFVSAYKPLIILLFGQAVFSLGGVAMITLNMSGRERSVAQGFGVAVVVNILGALLLIPYFGIVGAALATCASGACLAGLLAFAAKKDMGISTNPLRALKWLTH